MRLLAFLILALAQSALVCAQERPGRIVSANLCADQLLLALADPDQIASLSPLSRDAELSWFAERARAFPVNRGTGEDIVRLDADLVLVGPYDSRYTRALLAARRMRFLALDAWTSFSDGATQIRDLAALLGHPERGEALIRRIEDGLAQIDALGAVGVRATSLVLHRRGFVFHSGLTGEIARRAGLHDLAPEMNISGSGFVSLEKLVAARPDYLLVTSADAGAMDQGQAFLAHPALLSLWPPHRRLVLPDRMSICSGPSTPAQIEQLVSEINAKVR